MRDYIERGTSTFPTFFSKESNDYQRGWNHCLRAVYQQPAADVRPAVSGEWLKPHFPYAWYPVTCSKCGYAAPDSGWTAEPWETDWYNQQFEHFKKEHPFCTNCGADMRPNKTQI